MYMLMFSLGVKKMGGLRNENIRGTGHVRCGLDMMNVSEAQLGAARQEV